MREFYVYAFVNGSVLAKEDDNWQLPDIKLLHPPFYVGKGKGKRIYEHFIPSTLYKFDTPFYRKLRKLIREEVFDDTVHIVKLYEGLSEEEAWNKEKELIKFWGKVSDKSSGFRLLYNVADGGAGGNTLTSFNRSSAKQAHSKAMKIVVDDEYKRRCSDSHIKLWRDESYKARHTAGIQNARKVSTLELLSSKLNQEVVEVRYHFPGGYSFNRLRAREQFESLVQAKITPSFWRSIYTNLNSQLISERYQFSQRSKKGNKVKVDRPLKCWNTYPFLRQYEGKSFFEAGFYLKVIFSTGEEKILAGRDLV